MKLGFITAILDRWTYEEMMDFASEQGFECVEVACWPQEKAERRYAGVSHIDAERVNREDAYAEHIVEYAKKSGVEISALAYYPNVMAADKEKSKAAVEHLKQVILASKKLGVGMVTTFIGRDQTKNVQENLELVKEIWPPIIKLAEECDVKVAIENCPCLLYTSLMYIKRFVKHYYIMLIPALLWLFFFSIVPMFGIVMAFQDYNPGQGILHSKFVGLANFEYMFQMSDITQVLRNTVVIAVGKIIGNIIIPLVFALLLNELAVKKLKRPIQTIVYLPYFLSWVILAKIVLNIFGYTGPVNQIIGLFGGDAVNFFGEAKLFQPLVIGTDIWKGFGYNTVVYLAAILGVDGSLYEAAAVDGCGRFKRIWHVTLPGIKTTVALLAILSLGNVLNAGFDQIYNLYNPLVYSTGDIIDTWVYRAGLQNLQYSLATAVGLFKSVISLVLITVGYWLADKFTGYKLF